MFVGQSAEWAALNQRENCRSFGARETRTIGCPRAAAVANRRVLGQRRVAAALSPSRECQASHARIRHTSLWVGGRAMSPSRGTPQTAEPACLGRKVFRSESYPRCHADRVGTGVRPPSSVSRCSVCRTSGDGDCPMRRTRNRSPAAFGSSPGMPFRKLHLEQAAGRSLGGRVGQGPISDWPGTG